MPVGRVPRPTARLVLGLVAVVMTTVAVLGPVTVLQVSVTVLTLAVSTLAACAVPAQIATIASSAMNNLTYRTLICESCIELLSLCEILDGNRPQAGIYLARYHSYRHGARETLGS